MKTCQFSLMGIFWIYRFDAAKTCPEPSTFVNKKEKVLKVKVCHLTQFALFWTFEAEYGIFEFDKQTNGMFSHPTTNVLRVSECFAYTFQIKAF